MATTYRTREGDVIDLICHLHYGHTRDGVVECVLDNNRGLASRPPVLPAGVMITLPDPPALVTTQALVKLWD